MRGLMIKNQIRFFGALLGAAALSCLLAPQARADAPALMTYQGRLKESGLPVTGNRAIDIVLYKTLAGACGGTCTDTGAQNVSVVNGLFRTTFTAPGWI